jgi:hypothetical protein
VWSKFPGPLPLRDSRHPFGFPWRTGKRKSKCAAGTGMAKFACDVLRLALTTTRNQQSWLPVLVLLEHPEDLGRTKKGTPASIWQLPWTRELQDHGALRGAMHQCHYGAPFAKPTGLLFNFGELVPLVSLGFPTFDPRTGAYKGPLPRSCGHPPHESLGGTKDGTFKTSGTGAYPPAMCEAIAQRLALAITGAFSVTRSPTPLVRASIGWASTGGGAHHSFRGSRVKLG